MDFMDGLSKCRGGQFGSSSHYKIKSSKPCS